MKEQTVKKAPHPESYTLMQNPNPDGKGDLILHEGAVATIVKRITLGIPGVSRFSGSSFIDNIAEIVRSKKMQDRSIVLKMSSKSMSVDLSLYALWGTSLPQVASKIKESLSAEIFNMTGIPVKSVNINFRGMDEEPAANAEKSEESEEQEGEQK